MKQTRLLLKHIKCRNVDSQVLTTYCRFWRPEFWFESHPDSLLLGTIISQLGVLQTSIMYHLCNLLCGPKSGFQVLISPTFQYFRRLDVFVFGCRRRNIQRSFPRLHSDGPQYTRETQPRQITWCIRFITVGWHELCRNKKCWIDL